MVKLLKSDNSAIQETSQSGPAVNRDEWLNYYGFPDDPFSPEAVRAEADVLLKDGGTFIQFPYYEAIKGCPRVPGPRFIFAGRGSGKTALRMELQRTFTEGLKTGTTFILPVTYNNFDILLERSNHIVSKVTPRYHVNEIVRLIVKGIFDAFVNPDIELDLEALKNEHIRRLFVWYIENYGIFHPWQMNKILGQVEGLKHFITKQTIFDLAKGAAEFTAEQLPLGAKQAVKFLVDVVKMGDPISVDKKDVSMMELLNGIVIICKKLGFDAIYVLVDDVDEPQYYGEHHDFKPAFELIHTIASAQKVIGIPNLIFKFFLPSEIRSQCIESLRLDKFSEQVVTWKYTELKNFLGKRLRFASDQNVISSLDVLCDGDSISNIDELIVDFAKEKGNPRALVYVGNQLITEHFRTERIKQDALITRATWERARQRAEEVL